MLDLPASLHSFFIITTLLFYVMFLFTMIKGNERVKKRMHMVTLLLLAWLIFQSTLSLNGWYMDRKTVPPHVMFPLVVMFVSLGLMFGTGRGRRFVGGLNDEILTWLHVVRIPVEIALYLFASQKAIPWSMTFEGHNFDIIFGITAPIVAILAFRKKVISMKVVRIWNVLGLISVLIVVITGVGAIPNLQWWDGSQPNYAVMHFPGIWLPAFIVPVVIFSHLAFITGTARSMKSEG